MLFGGYVFSAFSVNILSFHETVPEQRSIFPYITFCLYYSYPFSLSRNAQLRGPQYRLLLCRRPLLELWCWRHMVQLIAVLRTVRSMIIAVAYLTDPDEFQRFFKFLRSDLWTRFWLYRHASSGKPQGYRLAYISLWTLLHTLGRSPEEGKRRVYVEHLCVRL